MASHGAIKEQAATHPVEAKPPKKELREIALRKSANGGVIAEHQHNVYDGLNKPHTFGAGEGHLLAAHLEKHLGIKMPGKAAEGTTEVEDGQHE